MKKIALLLLTVFSIKCGMAQARVMSDGSITYNIQAISESKNPTIVDAFDGSSFTVLLKGNNVRTDFKSLLRTQSIFYNGADSTATILKESGKEKYMFQLTSDNWTNYNKRYLNMSFSTDNSKTKTIAGHTAVFASGTTVNGEKINVWYTTQLTPQARGYDYVFKNLNGLPLEYEVINGDVTVKYTAVSVLLAPVSASRFDKPTSGYKIVPYQNQN